jgi:hypothetical protein
MRIMAGRKRKCRAQTSLSGFVFYLFLKLPGSEISGVCHLNQACSCFACFDASFDPKPD